MRIVRQVVGLLNSRLFFLLALFLLGHFLLGGDLLDGLLLVLCGLLLLRLFDPYDKFIVWLQEDLYREGLKIGKHISVHFEHLLYSYQEIVY